MKLNQIKIEHIILLFIVILGIALRTYGLDRSLWLDEVISVNVQRDLPSLLSNIYMPQNSIFIILHFFMLFGNSEVIVRLPSVIFGLLGIFLIYKVGKQFFGRSREGLIGAFLLSISTMHIQHSQEARYYSFTTFLTLLSVFFFHAAIRKKSKKLWVAFIFSTIAAVLSHWYMIFVLFIEMTYLVFMIIENRSRFDMRLRKIGKKKVSFLFLSLIFVLLLSVPYMQKILELFLSGSAIRGVSTWGLPPESFFQDLFSFFSFGYPLSYFSYLVGTLLVTSFFVVVLFFLSIGLCESLRKYREQAVFLFLWIFLPAIILFVISLAFNSPVTDAKYLIFSLPGYLLCISKGISFVSDNLLRFYYKIIYGVSSIPLIKRRRLIISVGMIVVIVGAFMAMSAFSLREYYKSPSEDWKSAVEYLEINSLPGDVIIIEPVYLERCLLYYYERNSSTADFMKSITRTVGYSLSRFEDLISKYERVWVVISPRHMQDFNPGILDWILHNSSVVGEFYGISIYSHIRDMIFVSSTEMSFVGLDSPLGETEAKFFHENDSATFNVSILNSANYTIKIHAVSWINSALELVINGESKGTIEFFEENWSYVELGTFYMNSGLNEIQIINREGGVLGDTNVVFDQISFWPN